MAKRSESETEGDGFYRRLIDQMSDGVYFVNRQRRITYWSGGAERLTGLSARDVEARRCGGGLLNHVDDEGVALCGRRCPLMATMRDGEVREAHVYLRHGDGHRRPVWIRAAPLHAPDGRITGAVETFCDDSATRAAQAELGTLRQAAMTDPLTGLGNRRYLETQLESWLDGWMRDGEPFGVLFADIDLFKKINDTYGHEVGDEALAMVARTLSFAVRSGDVVARYGGEEFVVLVHADPEGVAATGERVRSLVAASRLVVAREMIDVTVSVGVTMATVGDGVAGLLRRADMALYTAKQGGRNRVESQGMPVSA